MALGKRINTEEYGYHKSKEFQPPKITEGKCRRYTNCRYFGDLADGLCLNHYDHLLDGIKWNN